MTSDENNEGAEANSTDESDDELNPYSDSDTPTDATKTKTMKSRDLPAIRPLSREISRKRKSERAPSSAQLRRLEAKTRAFLMKTMDNTHIRLDIYLATSYEIFQAISKKYEGVAFHGDPYFIQHYLMELKYEEGSDLMENAMKTASNRS
ncbi:TPA: hypothetical protein N0F65_009052 [Lagenidium giganteum]|uniref:Uncharacterized protein n=1 Tax=Lagenidium giganteum TaxID=4803 RepID=A0AAV2YG14_9STRA|nr:TPA: hypothetical protein N0F65_009052 [Lagenidium giganteum]